MCERSYWSHLQRGIEVSWWQVHFPGWGLRGLWSLWAAGLQMPPIDECFRVLLGYDECDRSWRFIRALKLFEIHILFNIATLQISLLITSFSERDTKSLLLRLLKRQIEQRISYQLFIIYKNYLKLISLDLNNLWNYIRFQRWFWFP